MAFSVKERIAFWDFLVPKARPKAMRLETGLRGNRQELLSFEPGFGENATYLKR